MKPIRRLVVAAHRRSLWQVFTIYVALSWGAYQIISALPALIGIPEWVPGLSVALFLIGLPIVLATAFVQEGVSMSAMRADHDPTLLPDLTTNTIADEEPPKATVRNVLTWRRSLGAGVAAFVGLIILTGGYVGTRALGIGPAASLLGRGTLKQADVLVLADFTSASSDTALGHTITETLRVELARSAAIRLADPADVTAVLKRMLVDSASHLDQALATQAALRQNWKGVVAGEVGPVGTGYVITARIVDTKGATLASFRETARNADALIATIDRVARSIRARVGESLKSVNASQPLEEVTTASMPALRKYSEAVALPSGEGTPLLEEAVLIDSTFAMAWRKLGVWYSSAGRRGDAVRALQAAYRHRDHLSDVERSLLEADYYRHVEDNPQKAINSFMEALAVDSLQPSALNNLSELQDDLGNYEEARRIGLRGMRTRRDKPFSSQINALMDAQYALHDTDGMRETFRAPMSATQEFRLRSAAFAQALDLRGLDSLVMHPAPKVQPAAVQATMELRYLIRGQLDSMRARVDALTAGGGDRYSAEFILMLAGSSMGVDERATMDRLFQWLSGFPMDSPVAASWDVLGMVYARAGDMTRARAALAKAEARIQVTHEERSTNTALAALRAWIALAAGRRGEVLEILGQAYRGGCPECLDMQAAMLFDQMGVRDSAIARYERATHPRILSDALPLAITRGAAVLRLAELYDAAGNTQKAIANYSLVADLWRNGDGLARAKRAQALARIAALQTKGG